MANTLKLIRKDVGTGMKQAGMTKPATLIKITAGNRSDGNLAAGTNATITRYTARGLVSTDHFSKINDTVVQRDDRVVVLFGALIQGGAVPATKDKITIEGLTQPIVDVEVDAAKAAYRCLCRG